MNSLLKIGPICQTAGVTHRTVRYYEEYGFILPQKGADSAHKLYSADVVPVIKYVKFLQDIGYSLQQIKNLIGLTRSTRTKSRWLTLKLRAEVQKQHQLLAVKIKSLQIKEASLKELLQDTESCASCQSMDCAPCGKLQKIRALHINASFF
jgi:DNA-binding transcriptional MerR regulator